MSDWVPPLYGRLPRRDPTPWRCAGCGNAPHNCVCQPEAEDANLPAHPYSAAIEAGAKVLRQFRDTDLDLYTDNEIAWLVFSTMRDAIAAGTRSAETNEDLAQSEGCQSGPKGIAQKGDA